MTNIKSIALTLVLTFFCSLNGAQAQTARLSTVNVTSDGEKVHVATQGDVSEMRVEISDESGEVVFQSGQITGQTLDWKMTDAQGERVSPGTYLVTVTFRTAAGKLRKRVEQVTVQAGDTSAKESSNATAAPQAVQAVVNTAGTTTTGYIPKFASASTITNSVIREDAGNIGIGAVAQAPWRLDVTGAARVKPHPAGDIRFSTPNTETGMSIIRGTTGRADVRFNGQIMTLAAGTGIGVPANTGIVVNTDGNVGIGTYPSTSARLTLRGGINVYATAAAAAVQATAVTSAYGLSGRSFNGAGVYGESNAASVAGVGVAGKNTAGGWAMYAAGNTGQNLHNSGWVKAMLYVGPGPNLEGQVVRCFNSQKPDGGASLPPNGNTGCGFTVTRVGAGVYNINFDFLVSGRFASVTPFYRSTSVAHNLGANFRFNGSSSIDVFTFAANDADDTTDANFMIIVF